MRDTSFSPPREKLPARLRAAAVQALGDAGRVLRGPRFAPVVGAAVAIAALSGPFGTYDDLGAPLRLAYWALAIGLPSLFMTWLSFFWWRLSGGSFLRVALVAWASGVVPVWLLLSGLEFWLIHPDPLPPLALLPLVALPMLPVAVLANWFVLPGQPRPHAAIAAMARPDPVATVSLPPDPAEVPGVLARLPPRLGRDLVSLNAQGHYLEVVTLKGKALILMPISQAEVELAGWPGLRVHRSWWVNLTHVRRAVSRNGRLELELATGQRVPVARALVRSVRAALDRHGPPDLAG